MSAVKDIQAPDKNTGMLTVSTKAGKTGVINQQGEVQYTKKTIEEVYYIIEAFGEFGLVDTKNKQLCPCHYKQINHLYGQPSIRSIVCCFVYEKE